MSVQLSALDEKGQPVDWWFAYKVPKLSKTSDTDSSTGYEYIYFDPNIGKVVQSPNLLTDGKGALDLTLSALFDNHAETTGWILYNDEVPLDLNTPNNNALGHTKGVLAFDTESKTAFWLLHSWPEYADPKATKMPTPIYGQTFLCISIDMETASQIAEVMANHQEPQVYSPRIPDTLSNTDPLFLLTQPLNANATGDSHVLECKSRGGLDFKVIAKNRKWGKDFWNDLVGPTLQSDMDVETWIRGAIPPTLDSDGVHKIVDVKFIDLKPLGFPFTWSETHDHSKWGLTVDSDWVCVGDINRMISQEKRGGGTIAFQNNTLWTALQQTDLIVPPTGQTTADTINLIQQTHVAPSDVQQLSDQN